jgi:hypothetical protein
LQDYLKHTGKTADNNSETIEQQWLNYRLLSLNNRSKKGANVWKKESDKYYY